MRDNELGWDCASKGEIQKVLKIGGKVEDIIFSNSVKLEKDIYYASKVGVNYTTADTLDEIKKISRIAPQMNVLWRISIKEKNA